MDTKEKFIGQLEKMAKPISMDPVNAKRWVENEFESVWEFNPHVKLDTSMSEMEIFAVTSPDIFLEGYIMEPIEAITGRTVTKWLDSSPEQDVKVIAAIQDIANGEGTIEEKFDAMLTFAEKNLFILN